MKKEDIISKDIVSAAIEVHKTLGGPGLLESVYEEAFVWEMRKKYNVQRQVPLPIIYKENKLGHPLIMDVVVDDIVIVECKATSQYNKIFESQLLTYLRLSDKKLGLIINFGEALVKDGIHRVVNGL